MAEVVRHLLTRQSHGWYEPDDPKSPRQNPTLQQAYFNAVGELLSDHKGQVVHLEEELGGDPWIVAEAVGCWRRLGWLIEAQRGHAGYRFVGVQRPPRWTRLDTVYREHVGAIVMRPQRRRALVAVDGQMDLLRGET